MSEEREDEPSTPEAPPRPPEPRGASASMRVLVLLSAVGAVLFGLSLAGVLYLVAWESPGEVREGSFLDLKLSSAVQDAPAAGGLMLDPQEFPPVTSEVAAMIRKAANDERIDGVLLRIEDLAVGWGGVQEVRGALVALREAGKPCVAYAETYSTTSYYLASACDEVALAPAGIGLVLGISSTTSYYKGTFDKLGIDPEFEHVGDFKTAVEPFERTEPSEAAQEATRALLDSLWGTWRAEVASSRGVSEETVQSWVDSAALSPSEAAGLGMVDVLAFPDQVKAGLSLLGAEDWPAALAEAEPASDKELAKRLTAMGEYLKDLRQSRGSSSSYVAVLHAKGSIVSGEAPGGLFSQQVVADKTFSRWIREAREDDRVVGMVIRVDSPGGSGLASDMIWREIKRFQATDRPVVVSMADLAASGGYYLSAPADWIVAQPGTLTGSIGVFGGKLNLSGAYDKLGITQSTATRGEHADLFSSTSSFSDSGREAYRTFLQDFYDRFLERVAEGRDLSTEEVHEVAQGRVWTGQQALDRGLVDELGGLDRAVAKVEEISQSEDLGLVRWPKRKGFVELLLEDLESGGDVSSRIVESVGRTLVPLAGSPLTAELVPRRHVDTLWVLDRVLADGVAAWLPGVDGGAGR